MRSTAPTAFSTAAILLIGLVGMLCLASGAAAGEVHFDTGSPAGKEYAVPLPQARGEALGTNAPADPPPFGVGIGEPGKADEGEGGSPGESAGGGGGGAHKGHHERSPAGESGHGATGGGGPSGGGGSSGGGGGGISRNVFVASSSYDATGAIALLAGIVLAAVLAGLALKFLPAAGRSASGRDAAGEI